MWLKTKKFVDRVKQWWSSYQFQGAPSFNFAKKLKALKRDLKLWNMQSLGNIGANKKIKMMEIQEIERLQEKQPLAQEEQEQKTSLVVDLERMILLEEVSWRKKSRVLWLKEGNQSMNFFHRIADSHKRHNKIEVPKIDGVECREEQVIHNHVIDFFEKLLTEQVG
ncbi:hypothetical protein F2P56_023637 [Juglans regia]|uniref:Uncharacterized protein n=1 Tax=Juglans regia TaxID=51240 RepID=A0A833UEL2_JUGRE|nr:hypothetical protein F2P56_023637 [Juglans regia]